MSDDAAAKPKKGKGGKMKLIIIGAGALVLGGGGAAAGFLAAGSMHGEEKKEDPNKPVLVPRGQTAEAVAAAHGFSAGGEGGDHGGGGGGGGGAHGEIDPDAPPHHPEDLPRPKNTQAYQATYYQIPTPFTSNLIDTDAFAQMTIAIATYYDQRVIAAIQTHELAIRSSVLMMLAQQQESDLSTPQGKERLQAKIVKTINQVLMEKTGYSGVDNVYFTSFVIQ